MQAIRVDELPIGVVPIARLVDIDLADLTVYSKVEKQAGCCSPDCCSSDASGGSDLHDTLHELMQRYNINDYAASVKVYAVKP